MIFLIKLYSLLDCIDCLKYQQVVQEYCDRTPTELQIIDVDDFNNLSIILNAKIKGIPYTVFYDIHGSVIFNLEGVHSAEDFDQFIYNNRH